MNVLVIGGGGREHALAWKLAQSDLVEVVFVAPGNAGSASEPNIQNVAIDPLNFVEQLAFVTANNVELTIVGPEQPLVDGIVDYYTERGHRCFGPSAAASQLEGSKSFTKDFLARNNIPTAAYEVFTDADLACAYLSQSKFPIVIKADGLAAGKGVVIAESLAEAKSTVGDMLAGNSFGDAGRRVVIEEFMQGEEASFIAIVDGTDVLPFASSQDHKAALNGDKGPNTGGMGAYSPAPVVTAEVHEHIMRDIMQPTVEAMAKEGNRYRGFLYAGVMIDELGAARVVEFNCRFGDPETQPILMRLQSSMVDLVAQGLAGKLPSEAKWDARPALGIVVASKGYPETSSKGDVIAGLPELDPNNDEAVKVFHAGTALSNDNDKEVVTNGGRVLCVTALADSISDAQQAALAVTAAISFDGAQYRRDIGHHAITRENA